MIRDGIVPTDEKDDEDNSFILKQVNNSNFVPSMHSRYITDDSKN